jgi:hypothetical protein
VCPDFCTSLYKNKKPTNISLCAYRRNFTAKYYLHLSSWQVLRVLNQLVHPTSFWQYLHLKQKNFNLHYLYVIRGVIYLHTPPCRWIVLTGGVKCHWKTNVIELYIVTSRCVEYLKTCVFSLVSFILHGSTTQKTALNIILAAVRTWNLTFTCLFNMSIIPCVVPHNHDLCIMNLMMTLYGRNM